MDMETDMDNSSSPMMMMSYFNFMMPFTVVFKGWKIATQGQLIGSCFGVAGVAMTYEILKNLRQLWANKILRDTLRPSARVSPSTSDYCHDDKDDKCCSPPTSPTFWFAHLFQSILHMIQIFVAYLLMLMVMTFNVWLFISIVLGAGVGHLVAGGIFVRSDDLGDSKSELISTRVKDKGYLETDDRKSGNYEETSTSSSEYGYHDNKASAIKD